MSNRFQQLHKIQSQNVSEMKSRINLAAKRTATLIEGLATIPGVSQVLLYIYWEASYSRIERKQGFSLFSRCSNGNQQFGDEHGLG
jgi:iron complex outermembrane receptor protein